jgi:hypothetical protein
MAFVFDVDSDATPAVMCGWCKVELRSGSLPATHGICEPCQKKLDEQIAAYAALKAKKESKQ